MRLSIDIDRVIQALGELRAIKAVKEAGFDAYDFGFFNEQKNAALMGSDYKRYYIDLRKETDRIGFVCNQAHAPFPVAYGSNFNISDKMYLAVVRSMECAAILGAENIIIHPIVVPDDVDEHECNKEFYKSLEPYAQEFGIHIGIENLYKRDLKRRTFKGVFGTPDKMQRLICELDSDRFVMCLDTGHAALTGVEPEEYILGMDNTLLGALHVHDTDYLDDTHTLPYLGKHNWEAICKALKTIDYKGDFTFEIPCFTGMFGSAMIPDALVFSAKIGRHLIGEIIQ